MGDSSDSEEFFDAEEFTPVKGSKRSSICKNINVTDSSNGEKERKQTKTNDLQAVGVTSTPVSENTVLQDDRNTVKNVVQGRKRFQELRRCMQTEEEDEPDPGAPVSAPMEHPFKIISHDTMSLQSMTSLGRIGRILSGVADSHQNIRESTFAPSASSREPSTISDDPLNVDRNQTIALAMAEPDVIASTKANSLKQSRAGAVVAVSGAEPRPVAPPRRKKRNKLHGSQSLSTTEGDNLSVSDSHRPLDDLLVEPLSNTVNQTMSLPSPASTIESLTREFQDSLELSQSKYAADMSSLSVHESRSSERASTSSRSSTATSLRPLPHHSTLDIKEAVKGDYVVRPQDEERARGGVGDGGEGEGAATGGGAGSGGSARTHSEGRPPTTGTSSLGSATRRGSGARARRRSAGDPPQGAALGPQLSDIEILEQVTVLNLDTGERMPLSVAEHKLPQCINPLSLHIMRLTSEYIGRTNDDEHTSPKSKPKNIWRKRASISISSTSFSLLKRSPSTPIQPAISILSIDTRETDEESESVCAGGAEDEMKEIKKEGTDRQTTAIKRKTEKLKRFFGSTVKKTVDAAKSLAQEVSHARHKEDVADIADDVRGEHNIKLKASNSHKGPYDFDGCVRYVQEMGAGEAGEAGAEAGGHAGAVWCCKFSVCGRLLATAGQDRLLRIWVTRDAHRMFQDMRTKYNAKQKASPTPSQESLASLAAPPPSPEDQPPIGPSAPFCPKPFCIYSGHTSDLLDVSWSKNNFILSSSMDKTVRLWHISRGECLCCFQHIDFVTAIVFHPRDDRYFLSGSLDGKLRLWDIPDKKVAVWNEVDGKTKLITAANFCQNGKFAVVGTYDGRCIFYTTDQLKYHTQIDVRSTRGKNSTGRKISGIEPMPNDDKILVTSNDSRIRLYDLRDLNLSCKYKGYVNVSSQIKASFSHDGKYIVSGSENQCIYIWKTCHDYSKFTSVRRDRNDFWEGIKAHNAVVTCAVFAPNPDHMIRMINEREEKMNANAHKTMDEKDEVKAAEGGMVSSSQTGHVLVSADFNGCIKVFVHKAKPKHSSLPASALA
ncbi:WD repeat-containing protein 44 isoform X1 [Vanessa atalanta]|uniref:WD repeat-containing protein 44 isoform X1 n=1 Tax=Vanessa atalanta TaxID=42275 RepID=UPI001FCCCD26|nr:WD repeat-containing protein 44 isoform X1 [Vanessa atalanta]